jgi:uncharacterized protein YjbI with pentapeptide repeats
LSPISSKRRSSPIASRVQKSEAAPAESGAPSAPPEPQASTSATSAPDLPPIAPKADDLETAKRAIEDAASVAAGLWLSYLGFLFYLAIAAGAVTHADLFFERPVKLPFLNVDLPLLAFFFVAPILFLVVHAYTLVHLVLLADKVEGFRTALSKQTGRKKNLPKGEWGRVVSIRAGHRRQFPSNIFVQFLARPADVREGAFGWVLQAIVWLPLVVAPVLLLSLFQIQFLPYHNSSVTWTHRIVLLLDMALPWWLWPKILSEHAVGERRTSRAGLAIGSVLILLVVLFSWTEATFPGEWQNNLPNQRVFWFPFPKPDRELVTLNRLIFQSDVDATTRHRRFPFSSTLVLPGLNIYEGLGIDDAEKVRGRDFVFRARGRDLRGAIFDLASLPKVDFDGADLRGAELADAQLQGASLKGAKLQGATLFEVQLRGATLDGAQLQGDWLFGQLQGTSLDSAQLQRADLDTAQLQGASLKSADLQGASLEFAGLQGASLENARLQGAKFSGAQLQGAYLRGAQLQGASLSGAVLQGADLEGAQFQGARLFEAQLKGTRFDGAQLQGAYLEEAPLQGASRKTLETTPVGSLAYAKDLTVTLKGLACSGDDNAAYVLRRFLTPIGSLKYTVHGPIRYVRLDDAGSEAPALIDLIMSNKDCPVVASLTDADKASLMHVKQAAIEQCERKHGVFRRSRFFERCIGAKKQAP